MMQFESFNGGKADLVRRFEQLEAALRKLGPEAQASEEFRQVTEARERIKRDELCIALFGAFSDGKTSVAAGWLGTVFDDMKISSDESSDEVVAYDVPGLSQPVKIIDTPGLFGDKVLASQERYDEATRNFISSAHIVLYVVDATNPIKDSHGEALRWVMRDLGKLDSTIFVINKMDEVADLRDVLDYDEQARIKKDNLIGKLVRHLELSAEEAAAVKVVCVAANPSGRGLGFWFEEPALYEHRSRISLLRHQAAEVLAGSSREVLLQKAGASVLGDLVSKWLDGTAGQIEGASELEAALGTEVERLRKDIEQGRRAVRATVSNLRKDLYAIEGSLLAEVRSLAREDVGVFIEEKIGLHGDQVGGRLRSRIEEALQECADDAIRILKDVNANIENSISNTSEVLDAAASAAMKGIASGLGQLGKVPPETIKAGIFAARDALGRIAGWTYKFKPWEASKYAGSISRFAGPVGAGITVVGDVVGMVRERQQEKELAETKANLTGFVKAHFQTVYDVLDDRDRAIGIFAPQLNEFTSLLDRQMAQLGEVQQRRNALQEVRVALGGLAPTARA